MTSKQYGPNEPESNGSTGPHDLHGLGGLRGPDGPDGPQEQNGTQEANDPHSLKEPHGSRGPHGPGETARSESPEDGVPQGDAPSAGRKTPPSGPDAADDNGAKGAEDAKGAKGAEGAEGETGRDDGLGAFGASAGLHGLGGPGGLGGLGGLGGPGDRAGAGDHGGDGGDAEEALRTLLQSAVRDLEPSPDSLEHLRRAVPARRRRRRHAVAGAAAVLIFGGTAMPAMLHVANGGDDADRSANAASSSRAHFSTGGTHGGAARHESDRPAGKDDEPGAKDGKKTGKDKGKAKEGASEQPGGPAADPAATMDVTSPACLRSQLGNGSASVAAADAEGRVYGTIRIVNVSTTACSVDGGGSVTAVAQGSADASRVQVVDHTAGDAATGLPDPAVAPGQLVLKPGEAYEVKFAWIPAEGGGPSGCAAPGTPTPGSSEGAGSGEPANTTSAEGGGSQTGGGNESAGDGGAQAASVAVSHTPEAGEPAAASTTINDACAGTVYRTGALPAQ